jgi:excisionase family DNA binding protein
MDATGRGDQRDKLGNRHAAKEKRASRPLVKSSTGSDRCYSISTDAATLQPIRNTAVELMPATLMTKTDLANRVGCHPRTIDNLIARREGPVAIRIGRLVRFNEADIIAWLDHRRCEPIPPSSVG